MQRVVRRQLVDLWRESKDCDGDRGLGGWTAKARLSWLDLIWGEKAKVASITPLHLRRMIVIVFGRWAISVGISEGDKDPCFSRAVIQG